MKKMQAGRLRPLNTVFLITDSHPSIKQSLHRAGLIFGIAIVCFLASLMWSQESLAQDPHHEPFTEQSQSVRMNYERGARERLMAYTDYLASKRQRSLFNANTWKAEAAGEHQACARTYNRIFEDGIMRVNIAFGYSDLHSRTLDFELYEATVDALSRSCGDRRTACGFKLVSGSNSRKAILEKSFTRPSGEDLNHLQAVKIRMTVTHASANADDDANFADGKVSPAQKSATRIAENVFFGGIRGIEVGGVKERADVVIYYGHARDGGGPDFSPVPREWLDSEGKIDYEQYHRRKTNYRTLIGALEAAQDAPPSLIAILACYSHTHFSGKKVCADNSKANCAAKNLADFKANTGYITTTDYSWFENFEKTFGTVLDTVTGLKCLSGVKSNLGALRGLPEFKESYGVYGSFLQ